MLKRTALLASLVFAFPATSTACPIICDSEPEVALGEQWKREDVQVSAELVPPGASLAGRYGDALWLAPDGRYVLEWPALACSDWKGKTVLRERGTYSTDGSTVTLSPATNDNANMQPTTLHVLDAPGGAILVDDANLDDVADGLNAYARVDELHLYRSRGVSAAEQPRTDDWERLLGARLLAEPVLARTVAVAADADGGWYTVTVDRGSADGIAEETELFRNDAGVNVAGTVSELREHEADLRLYYEAFDRSDDPSHALEGGVWSTRSRDVGTPQRVTLVEIGARLRSPADLDDYAYRDAIVRTRGVPLEAGQYLWHASALDGDSDLLVRVISVDGDVAHVRMRKNFGRWPRAGETLADRAVL